VGHFWRQLPIQSKVQRVQGTTTNRGQSGKEATERAAKKDGMVFLIIMTITYVINLYVCNDWFIGILEKIWK